MIDKQFRFEELYRQYYNRLVVIAQRYVRDASVAEDIVMESFISLWENRDRFNGDESKDNIPAYLTVTVKNRCLDYLYAEERHCNKLKMIHDNHSRLVRANIISLQSLNPEQLFTSEIRDILNKEMAHLPELTRQVFELSRIYSKTYEEIAAQLGISRRRVTSEIQKALSTLRIALKDYLPLHIILWLLGTN